jgi:Sulfotransferase family
MIISFSRRFLFVAVPKTAGHAVRIRLREHLSRTDWEQCALFERKVFPVEALAVIPHGHVTCMDVKPYLLPGMWDQFFKFAFVRDPFDRFISAAWFHHKDTGRMRDNPMGTMKAMLEARSHFLVRPQHEFICDGDGRLMVDLVGRYETLQPDFDFVCGQIGAGAAPLPSVNVTPKPRKTELDAELSQMVREIYVKDFELFGYSSSPA